MEYFTDDTGRKGFVVKRASLGWSWVQLDCDPWGVHAMLHRSHMTPDPERTAKVQAEWERHRDDYYERSARGAYQGD